MQIIWVLFILFCMAGVACTGIIHNRRIEMENQMLSTYMDSLHELYDMIEGKLEAARCYRHDLAKYIRTLEMMLVQNETASSESSVTQEYLDLLKTKYKNLPEHNQYCENEVMNAILCLKKQQCDDLHIPMQVEIGKGNYEGISQKDMTGLLYNLLDNAIEANEELNMNDLDKYLSIHLWEEEGHIFLTMQNRMAAGKKFSLRTHKKNAGEHGIGTQVIEKIVQQYNGKWSMKTAENQTVTTSVMICTDSLWFKGGEAG